MVLIIGVNVSFIQRSSKLGMKTDLDSWNGPRSYVRVYLVLNVGKCFQRDVVF